MEICEKGESVLKSIKSALEYVFFPELIELGVRMTHELEEKHTFQNV